MSVPQTIPVQTVAEATDRPRTWSFTSRDDGKQVTVICMPGCRSDHSNEMATPTHPDDIWCQAHGDNVFLPVNENGTPEEVRVLGMTLNVRPFDKMLAQRLPHVDIEVMEDCWIEGLGPDELETVIRTLSERVDAMRELHGRLVETRAAYRAAH